MGLYGLLERRRERWAVRVVNGRAEDRRERVRGTQVTVSVAQVMQSSRASGDSGLVLSAGRGTARGAGNARLTGPSSSGNRASA
jgi:hypothetical protein